MRYAIISDLHANQRALVAVLDWCERNGIDKIVNLGDNVGWGAQPNECCHLLKQRDIPTIAGNHDMAALGDFEPVYFKRPARHRMIWTRAILDQTSKDYLRALPETMTMGDSPDVRDTGDTRFLMVHGSLKSYSQYMLKDETILESFGLLEKNYPGYRLCFFGHTHRPATHQLRNGVLSHLDGSLWKLDRTAQYLINPGSIGYARYADIPLSFAVYDDAAQSVRLERMDKADWPELYKPASPEVAFSLPLAAQYAIFAKRSLGNFVRNRLR